MTALDDAFRLLEVANDLEERRENPHHKIEAATKYYEACYLMKRYLNTLPVEQEKVHTLIHQKMKQYEKRATHLLQGMTSPVNHEPRSPLHKYGCFHDESSVVIMPPPSTPPQISEQVRRNDPKAIQPIIDKVSNANSRLSYALDLDEGGQKQRAIGEYMAAAELYLHALQLAENNQVTSIQPLLKQRLEGALDRLEELKNPSNKARIHEQRVQQQQLSPQSKIQESGVALTEEEVSILKRSSIIASGLFLPWSDQDAYSLSLQVRKSVQSNYTDTDFPRKLSEKQTKHFYKWARPTDICDLRQKLSRGSATPITMINSITPYSIRQQYVTDCSFIASLCICAAFERKFQKKLVTSLIFPQNNQGCPIINPLSHKRTMYFPDGLIIGHP